MLQSLIFKTIYKLAVSLKKPLNTSSKQGNSHTPQDQKNFRLKIERIYLENLYLHNVFTKKQKLLLSHYLFYYFIILNFNYK